MTLSAELPQALWVPHPRREAGAAQGTGPPLQLTVKPLSVDGLSTRTDKRIYFDWNATTPCLAEVRQRIDEVLADLGGNPSSSHAEGRAARAVLDDARARIAGCLGAAASEIVFTGSGTEANQLALSLRRQGSSSDDRHRISSAIEHASLIEPLRDRMASGEQVSLTGCTAEGWVEPQEIAQAMRPETDWISVMLVNNETGVIQPVTEIAARAQASGAVIHTDAVQALGRLPLHVDTLGVDALSLSAHKIGGPPGIGALYMRHGLELKPMLLGGRQESGRRAGTENVAAAAGFAVAVDIAATRQPRETQRLTVLRDAFEAELMRVMEGIHINGAIDRRVPHTSSVSFDGCYGANIAAALDQAGFAVSVGSACHADDPRPSHVLEAMCLTPGRCRGAVRFSFGHATDRIAMERLLNVIPDIVNRLRSIR